jgi:hypothetical protein
VSAVLSILTRLQIPITGPPVLIQIMAIELIAIHFRRFRKIAKSDYWLRHVCPFICLHETTGLPLDGFS